MLITGSLTAPQGGGSFRGPDMGRRGLVSDATYQVQKRLATDRLEPGVAASRLK
jgi:hypothetical protein